MSIFSSLLRQIRLAHEEPIAFPRSSPAFVYRPDDQALAAAAVAGGELAVVGFGVGARLALYA
jgi:hypothetical protein